MCVATIFLQLANKSKRVMDACWLMLWSIIYRYIYIYFKHNGGLITLNFDAQMIEISVDAYILAKASCFPQLNATFDRSA